MSKTNREKLSDVLWNAGIFDHEYGDTIIKLFDQERTEVWNEAGKAAYEDVGNYADGLYQIGNIAKKQAEMLFEYIDEKLKTLPNPDITSDKQTEV